MPNPAPFNPGYPGQSNFSSNQGFYSDNQPVFHGDAGYPGYPFAPTGYPSNQPNYPLQHSNPSSLNNNYPPFQPQVNPETNSIYPQFRPTYSPGSNMYPTNSTIPETHATSNSNVYPNIAPNLINSPSGKSLAGTGLNPSSITVLPVI